MDQTAHVTECNLTGESVRIATHKLSELQAGAATEHATACSGGTAETLQETGSGRNECHAAQKQKQHLFFQTVNHDKVLWDLKSKPKGILGGHLNIQSIISKGDQIHTLLSDSNLDYLCLAGGVVDFYQREVQMQRNRTEHHS